MEKKKWEHYRKEEERRVRTELEQEVDAQVALFKEKLRQDEEREKLQLQKESDQ